MKRLLILPLLVVAVVAYADEPMCGTGPENDERLRALHERPRDRSRLAANAESVPSVHDGAFYLPVDDIVNPGYRPFDLLNQSLVFEPRNGTFAVRRTALQYVEPAGEPVREFQGATGAAWHRVEHDLPFAFPIFGQQVTKLYLTAFNGIHFARPAEETAMQFDDLEAAVHRDAVLSPLMITKSKPSRLHYPKLYVDQRPDAVVLTWRSTTAPDFQYDVQAELRGDGSFMYSYRTLLRMRWGTPVVSAGFNPDTATYRALGGANDGANDVSASAVTALRTMADLRRVEVLRVNESDLFTVRLKLGAPLIAQSIGDNQSLRYVVQIGATFAVLEVFNTSWNITSFYASSAALNGASVRIAGDVIEIYGIQLPGTSTSATHTAFAWSYTRPTNPAVDFARGDFKFDVPAKRIATDLSSANGSELPLPITEPFILGALDPASVWERLQQHYVLSDYGVDALAIYQTYFTDLIFYAGAYSTVGNPQVDGVRSGVSSYGTLVKRRPALLHMNQLEYGWNARPELASHVVLHEFGHRWLYFINIVEGGEMKRSLNPVSSHPGGFVHTPAAFRVYDEQDASVMGGGFFTQQPDGTYKARASNAGFSWTDLYLMGLAAPEEVPPWFYLANSNPALPLQYYPANEIVVTAEQRGVSIDQIIAAEGVRNPPAAMSQRLFKVLFVLVTEGEPTAQEIAKLNEWRALLETNFTIATGGRAKVETDWVRPAKRRAAR